MGCCENKAPTTTKEEQILRNKELLLGLSHFTCKEMDLFIRKICSKRHLNANQFRAFMKKLSEAVENVEFDVPTSCFFRSVLYYKGEYDRTLLLLMVVLYCRGSYADRARILLEIVDVDLRREIDLNDAQMLAHFMTRISLISTFTLVFEEAFDDQTTQRLKKYKSSLKHIAHRVEMALYTLLVGREYYCRLEDLQSKVTVPSFGRLLTAVGLREFACEILDDHKSSPSSNNSQD